MTARPKLSFIFNPAIPVFKTLGEQLTAQYGGVEAAKADILVPIGGDGSVLFALPMAKGRPVYGLVPNDSNSIAYTVNDYDAGEDLYAAIDAAERFPIHPLDAKLTFADGTQQQMDVYNSLNIVRDGGQAAMMNLTGNFNGAAQTVKLIGDGVAFSASIGSTALAYSQGGPILSPARPSMIFTGMGIGNPRGLNPIVAVDDESFSVECIVSKGKRPLRIDTDGNTLRPLMDNPVARVDVSINKNQAATLLVKKGSFHPFKRLSVG